MSRWLFGPLMCLVALPAIAAQTGTTQADRDEQIQSQIFDDGFCAIESAKECATILGVAWQHTDATEKLEQLPIASFGQIKQALESLGLNTKTIEMDGGNVHYVQQKLSSGATAIGWLSPSDMKQSEDLGIGHFAVLNDLRLDGEVAFGDATSADVYIKKLDDEAPIPLLLISSKSLEMNSLALSTSFVTATFQSPWMIGALAGFILCLCINWTRKTPTVKLGFYFFLGLAFASGFFLSRVDWLESEDDDSSSIGKGPLVFDQSKCDFGLMIKEKSQPHLIRLVNRSDRDIKLEQIQGSCVCMTATPVDSLVPANGDVKVEIVFSSMLEGPNGYVVNVVGSGGCNAQCGIVFEGKSSVDVSPTKHFLGSFSYAEDLRDVRKLRVEIGHFYDKPIYGVEAGEVDDSQPLQFSVVDVFGENNQHVIFEFRLNPNVERQGFVFQDIPLIVKIGQDKTPVTLSVGADYVD